MPLLDAPLPRMAGRLSFMRSSCRSLDEVKAGDLVIVGLPVDDPNAATSGQSLAPRGLRETSVYFGWHANPQFSHPIDVDDRRQISTTGMFDRMCDLGDLRAPCMPDAVGGLGALLLERGATAMFLGGTDDVISPFLADQGMPHIALGGRREEPALTLAPIDGGGVGSDPSRSEGAIKALVHDHIGGAKQASLRFDLSVFNASLSGLCDHPRLGGCALPEVASWLSVLGRLPVSCVFLTGLNPTLSGMGIIKTGQRLMVTALLSFIYAKLGAARGGAGPRRKLEQEVS